MSDWHTGIEAVMREHLSLADDELWEAVRLFERNAYLAAPMLRDKTNDVKGLDALETALRKLAPMLESISEPSIIALMSHFFHSGEYNEKDGKRLAGAVLTLTQERERLLAGIDAARRALDEPHPFIRRSLKTLNIEAIQITDAAVAVWAQYHHRPPPRKALNPASSFGKFMGDMFDACELEADPKAAFRAWAQTYGAAA